MADDALPARIDIAQSDEVADIVGEQIRDMYVTIMDTDKGLTPAQTLPAWIEKPIRSWLLTAYEQVVVDNKDVATALNEAQAKFDEYRECVIANEAFADLPVLNDCVLQVDPNAPFFGE
ncbi:MAG: hypothetical protein M5U34_44580 [Chloroflexi bacterium]|nr:hypothetical protein [Chloroflexota bacterium]